MRYQLTDDFVVWGLVSLPPQEGSGFPYVLVFVFTYVLRTDANYTTAIQQPVIQSLLYNRQQAFHSVFCFRNGLKNNHDS